MQTVPVAHPFLVPAGQGRSGEIIRLGEDSIHLKLSGADTDGQLAVWDSTVAPQSGPPLHFHTREDEWFFVLEGRFVFEVDGQTIRAEAGDSLFAPRLIPHTFQNVGPTPGRLLTVSEPAGMEDFFRELANCGIDSACYEAVTERFGISILGPPLSARPTNKPPSRR